MAYWIAILKDKSDAYETRLKTRPAHIEYINARKNVATDPKVIAAFPIGREKTEGSCVLFSAHSREEAEVICDNDPYQKAGVFASREIFKIFGDSFRSGDWDRSAE